MHCLVFRRPDAKKMEEESTEIEARSPQQATPEGFPSSASDILTRNIIASANASSLFFEDSIAGGGLTSSYGIQALINNVHLGYVNSDQTVNAYNLNEADDAAAKYDDDSFPQHSEILREWRNNKVLELQQKQKESQAKQEHVLEQAAAERANFFKERAAQIQARKALNREKEKIYHAHMESRQKLVEGNSWQAVAAYIELDPEATSTAVGNVKANVKGIKVPRPMSPMEVVNARRLESKKSKDSPRTSKKITDLSRMRQILTKLQLQALVR